MPKVIFFTGLSLEVIKIIAEYTLPSFDVTWHSMELPDDEKIDLLRDTDFLVLHPGQISERVLKSAHSLRLIQLLTAGFDQIDLRLCKEIGIPVANNGGANSIDVAEHTIALILCFYRRLIELNRNVHGGLWRGDINVGMSTYAINGKTLGIVGFGKIGQRVSILGRAFNANLIYYDINRVPRTMEQDFGIEFATLENLLQESDIVTVHVPLTPKTRGLIGTRELSMMKPTALLVNTSRGSVIDEASLIEVLRERRILGAALDVQEKMPPAPDNSLLELENVILTPHIAGLTYDTWSRRGRFIFQNIQRVWAGNLPLGIVSE